jgi:retron-type reverse transcriptase
MEAIAERYNLWRSWEQVAANDGAAGPDKQSVEAMRERIEEMLETLHHELLGGGYRPGTIRRVWIPKANGGQRGLGIPNVIDRIVQQAVHQVLSPIYEPTFHASSHGFRPRRSCHTAITEAQEHMRQGFEWVVDLDLEKFFDRVHHERLLARLKACVDDERVLALVRKMLKAKVVMPDGVVVATEEGTPQGGPLAVFHALQRILPFGLCSVASRDDVNQLLEQLNERRCRVSRTVERKSLVREVLLRARDKATGAMLQCGFGRFESTHGVFLLSGGGRGGQRPRPCVVGARIDVP